MMPGYRSNDAVLTICQNNSDKSIKIHDVNKDAEELLGYSGSQLTDHELGTILPPRIAELLHEYVEFESDANDVGMVLSKVQSFSIVGNDGKETSYRLKVVRAESTGEKEMFKLVLQDKAGARQNEQLRDAIQENFRGHEVIDADSGLPDRYSLNKDIELIGYYNNKSDLRSCCAGMQIDHYDELFGQYGKQACIAMLKHIAMICRQNLRPDDVVGSMSYKRIGILLLDTTPESARMTFNRLRWQIAANPYITPDKANIGLSVSIGFGRITGRASDKNLIERCEQGLEHVGQSSVNALVEID